MKTLNTNPTTIPGSVIDKVAYANYARVLKAALSGGLIGPPGTPRDYPGGFAGTPVFLGCSDRDPHIPRGRVDESAEVLRGMGAEVTERIYPAMGHTVNEDEMELVRGLVAGIGKPS